MRYNMIKGIVDEKGIVEHLKISDGEETYSRSIQKYLVFTIKGDFHVNCYYCNNY